MSDQSPDLPSPRKPRPSVELPPSVLSAIERRTGEAPRVTLREEDSGSAGAPNTVQAGKTDVTFTFTGTSDLS